MSFNSLKRLEEKIGDKCSVFASIRAGGLLVQVDWMQNYEHVRFQYVVSISEMLSAGHPEIIENYIAARARDEYYKFG